MRDVHPSVILAHYSYNDSRLEFQKSVGGCWLERDGGRRRANKKRTSKAKTKMPVTRAMEIMQTPFVNTNVKGWKAQQNKHILKIFLLSSVISLQSRFL